MRIQWTNKTICNLLQVYLQFSSSHCPVDIDSIALQILINFLQVTSLAVFINSDWTKSVSRILGLAGRTKEILKILPLLKDSISFIRDHDSSALLLFWDVFKQDTDFMAHSEYIRI